MEIVKDFKDGPTYHVADPKETNRALCGASTVPALSTVKWGEKNALVGETFCAKCGKPKAAKPRGRKPRV